jgi:hypothetical protein
MAASASSAAPPGCLDLEGFQKWSARVPAPKALLTGLLANIGAPGSDPHQHTGPGEAATGAAAVVAPGHTPSSPHPSAAHVAASAPQGGPPLKLGLPALVTGAPQPAPPRDGLLQPEWVWLLAPGLAPALRQEWRLLFSSDRHGASFNTFLARLGEAAPTLVLVRDHGGALFGGVAHAPWRRSGTFFGARGLPGWRRTQEGPRTGSKTGAELGARFIGVAGQEMQALLQTRMRPCCQ